VSGMDTQRAGRARSRHRARALASCATVLLLASALSLFACSTVEHGYGASEFHGRSLDTRSAPGRERLRLETEYDSAVRKLIEARGRPDYLHIENRDVIYLYYLEEDRAVIIRRQLLPPGRVQPLGRIPGHLLSLLPQSAIDQTLAGREALRNRKRHAEAKTRRKRASGARSASRRSHPSATSGAANARSTDTRFGNFDPNRIIQRLGTPMSAADAGVTGWRHYTLSDGRTALRANTGANRYQVRPDAVSVTATIGVRGKTASTRAMRAVLRINQAIFGTRAQAVSQRTEVLLSRVAADTSGRTRFVRRIAGRTIEVARDTSSGGLLYSVRAN
jgi:hypothetical protein